jgi:tRNA pseudouridine13 synthase
VGDGFEPLVFRPRFFFSSMKIKQDPADFQVDELTDLVPSAGPFALYQLEKTGWTTPDAINRLARAWKIPAQRISFGGLKDRHARTTQHITIEHGPQHRFAMPGVNVKFLGQTPQPFASSCITANRFRIVIRDLAAAEAEQALQNTAKARLDGFANYFDDQRFGSVQTGGEFMAKRLVLGDWEGGLKLALIEPYEHDRAAAKQEKAILRKHWGNWSECAKKLARGPTHRLIEHLAAQPGDFRGAVARLRGDLASLYLAAYQSHLWNRLLARWLERNLPPENRLTIRLKLHDVPMPRDLSAEQRSNLAGLSLPLPSARLKYDEAIAGAPADWPDIMRQILVEEGIDLERMKLQGLRKPFFSRGERANLCEPKNLAAESGFDERNANRTALTLRFDLPRGSYATLLIKRVTLAAHFDAE